MTSAVLTFLRSSVSVPVTSGWTIMLSLVPSTRLMKNCRAGTSLTETLNVGANGLRGASVSRAGGNSACCTAGGGIKGLLEVGACQSFRACVISGMSGLSFCGSVWQALSNKAAKPRFKNFRRDFLFTALPVLLIRATVVESTFDQQCSEQLATVESGLPVRYRCGHLPGHGCR